MFVLVDSNNFFASCERLFRPDLQNKPVIVLSSNDGCAVARSNEAKALGVKMGEPLHVLKDRFTIIDGSASARPSASARHSDPPLVVFSANFTLYGDVSRRIGSVLARVTPRIEFYSIDEAFLDVSLLDIPDYTEWGRALAARIYREIGVPVSVGIAPTKTLCKLAADCAKHRTECQGACHAQAFSKEGLTPPSGDGRRLRSPSARSTPGDLFGRRSRSALVAPAPTLAAVPIQDVWGIGWRLAPKLKAEGIHTAGDLAAMRPEHAGQLMGVHGRRMVAELQGTPCIPLNTVHKPQQVISRGRQFGHDTSDFAVISAATARMINHASLALRREGLLAKRATVWLSTNRKKPGYTAFHQDVHFYTPTADTGLISRQIIKLLERTFDTHHAWHKAEVTLWDLVSDSQLQTDVFGTVRPEQYSRSQKLMTALDGLNRRYGTHKLHYATESLSDAWRPRRNLASPNYTTDWQSLPIICAL